MQTLLLSRASLAMKTAHPAKDHQDTIVFLVMKTKVSYWRETLASDQLVRLESLWIWLPSPALDASSTALLVLGLPLSTASSAFLQC